MVNEKQKAFEEASAAGKKKLVAETEKEGKKSKQDVTVSNIKTVPLSVVGTKNPYTNEEVKEPETVSYKPEPVTPPAIKFGSGMLKIINAIDESSTEARVKYAEEQTIKAIQTPALINETEEAGGLGASIDKEWKAFSDFDYDSETIPFLKDEEKFPVTIAPVGKILQKEPINIPFTIEKGTRVYTTMGTFTTTANVIVKDDKRSIAYLIDEELEKKRLKQAEQPLLMQSPKIMSSTYKYYALYSVGKTKKNEKPIPVLMGILESVSFGKEKQ